ncbi:MAG TPA: TRAP transporter small permease [Candidatus Acidoferrum sp.]|nr:TRAP transporter small permease [Candidatus Acidoferrum sp.]
MSDSGHTRRPFERGQNRISVVGALAALCGLLVAIIAILVFAQVIARYMLNASLAWSEEATRLLFIYLVFFGFVVAVQTGRNLHVDLLVARMPAGPRRWMGILVHLVSAAFLAVVAWQGMSLVRQVSEQRTPALQLSKSFFYVPIPAASALLLFHLGLKIVSLYRER